ncbi:SMC-Scp complex subunit ScpB [Candidatus Woesearchaeota archaeon]|nr:SMC-Scp complex subunit ScpB [Candidatus Woesearchaeota archaeon]
MEENLKRIEAVLFAVGKEITSERIASLCSMEVQQVEEAISVLSSQYSQMNNSLQIIKKENGWKITVHDKYVPLVSSLVSSTELERPLMETLAVIAWRYPVVQSEVVKLRNAKAYDHMKQLEEMGFVAKEKFGRTFKLRLTKKFFEYFDLPSEEAKQAFLKHVSSETLKEAEEVDKEADEVERLNELQGKELEGKDEISKAMGELKK